MITLQRTYKMSDGKLVGTGMRVLVGANRDVATLTDFGWDQTKIDAVEADRMAFADLPTDVELSGMMAEATAAKNEVRKDATDHCMVQIMLRVSQHFGADSPTLKRFRAGELHTATDHGFWLVLKRIHRQATLLLADLAPEGMTQAHLDTLAQFITDMNNALLAQDTAIDDRDRAVQARIEAGNAFYAKLVKLAWVNASTSMWTRASTMIMYCIRSREVQNLKRNNRYLKTKCKRKPCSTYRSPIWMAPRP